MSSKASFFARYLDPLDQLSEFLFGLIMVLSFTLGAGLIVREGEQATTQMLFGILGCNIVWGLIDGAMYILSNLRDRSSKARLLDSIQKASTDQESLAVVSGVLDSRLVPLTTAEARKHLYTDILESLKDVSAERTRRTQSAKQYFNIDVGRPLTPWI
ncbi:MAG: hypothetical protein OQK99_05010 [Gammaproteobacteria bacterium]|nr:hypothetical protein [Gammaproteobacteria bacterium]